MSWGDGVKWVVGTLLEGDVTTESGYNKAFSLKLEGEGSEVERAGRLVEVGGKEWSKLVISGSGGKFVLSGGASCLEG